jgi:hypothetical protein
MYTAVRSCIRCRLQVTGCKFAKIFAFFLVLILVWAVGIRYKTRLQISDRTTYLLTHSQS